MHDNDTTTATPPLPCCCATCATPIHPDDHDSIACLVSSYGLTRNNCLACTLAELELICQALANG